MNSEHIPERHNTQRTGWLRAAVLGANDGILSAASLIVGVAAAHSDRNNILIAGVAALVAGAMSMAAGEYVSVSSQADTEEADLIVERMEHAKHNEFEHEELANIYVRRGLGPALARQVADELMAYDALGAHARDELGISEIVKPRPVQAAAASAASFVVGAALPLFVVLIVNMGTLIPAVSIASLVFLALLGGLAAKTGGSSIAKGALRVMFWGALALSVTAGIGTLVGTVI
ncbi:MAG TPA: VIT family protein [Candidatus Kapabacteria bacterium]|nr:VIT family protein [Candidatus Kapabacteria bacterium]